MSDDPIANLINRLPPQPPRHTPTNRLGDYFRQMPLNSPRPELNYDLDYGRYDSNVQLADPPIYPPYPYFAPDRNKFLSEFPNSEGTSRPHLSYYNNDRMPTPDWGLYGPTRPNNSVGVGDEIEALLQSLGRQ